MKAAPVLWRTHSTKGFVILLVRNTLWSSYLGKWSVFSNKIKHIPTTYTVIHIYPNKHKKVPCMYVYSVFILVWQKLQIIQMSFKWWVVKETGSQGQTVEKHTETNWGYTSSEIHLECIMLSEKGQAPILCALWLQDNLRNDWGQKRWRGMACG